MSFSGEIKRELSYQIPAARHCRLAEISAILSFCSHVREDTRSRVQPRQENGAAPEV